MFVTQLSVYDKLNERYPGADPEGGGAQGAHAYPFLCQIL